MSRLREHLSGQAIRALSAIILTATAGIIGLSAWGLALRYGLLGRGGEIPGGVADEALSILGNIAAAAVGGLVGWLTRDLAGLAPPPRDTPEAEDDPHAGPMV